MSLSLRRHLFAVAGALCLWTAVGCSAEPDEPATNAGGRRAAAGSKGLPGGGAQAKAGSGGGVSGGGGGAGGRAGGGGAAQASGMAGMGPAGASGGGAAGITGAAGLSGASAGVSGGAGKASGGSGATGGAGSPGSGKGSKGTGGPGPGEQALSFSRGAFSLHVPPAADGPRPLAILLHGQGDTGANFLAYWLSKGFGQDLLLAAPDDNKDDVPGELLDHLAGLYDVDLSRAYIVGHSQGGAYAAFVLFDAPLANRFAGILLNSSGLAQNPAGIPTATAGSPAISVCIDEKDPNNTGSLDGSTDYKIMEKFAASMTTKGYDVKLVLHQKGHTLPSPELTDSFAWLRTHSKPLQAVSKGRPETARPPGAPDCTHPGVEEVVSKRCGTRMGPRGACPRVKTRGQ